MKILKQIAFSLTLLMTPSALMAAQSVVEWDCGSDGYRIGMNENVITNSTITISIDGGSSLTGSINSDIATLVEVNDSFTCPPATSLSVSIGSSSYSADID
ncbi:MAG: hypothetical protein CBC70_05350 [Alphaproteobacteria bacterium TMED110]|nr:hypothetical protein [Hyphomicrobiales bacterium]OUV47502.1 MAG: hypothetical protein CBC70_05350 [Alphaproteobacteria bacterium TMED110]